MPGVRRGQPPSHRLTFGTRVRELRLERGLSQEGLPELAGRHRNYIGGIERGDPIDRLRPRPHRRHPSLRLGRRIVVPTCQLATMLGEPLQSDVSKPDRLPVPKAGRLPTGAGAEAENPRRSLFDLDQSLP